MPIVLKPGARQSCVGTDSGGVFDPLKPVCGGHGVCIGDDCNCEVGWFGRHCTKPHARAKPGQCANQCSGRGECVAVTNTTGHPAGIGDEDAATNTTAHPKGIRDEDTRTSLPETSLGSTSPATDVAVTTSVAAISFDDNITSTSGGGLGGGGGGSGGSSGGDGGGGVQCRCDANWHRADCSALKPVR